MWSAMFISLCLDAAATSARAPTAVVPAGGKNNGDPIMKAQSDKKLTRAKAQARAEALVAKENDSVLLPDRTKEYDFGWVFFWNSRAYARSLNWRDSAPGSVPFAITRDGEVKWLPDYHINGVHSVEDEWRRKHAAVPAKEKASASVTGQGQQTEGK